MAEFITELFTIVLIPLLGILTKYLVAWIQMKTEKVKAQTSNELARKYEDMISNTITQCVIATNQTYVEDLKRQGKFDAAAQKEALNKTLEAVKLMLSTEAQKYILQISGDINSYLMQLIESAVYTQKENSPLF